MPLISSSFTSVVRNPRGAALVDYLSERFPYHTPAEWRALIGQGRIALDGRAAAPDEIVREGQALAFAVVDYDEPEVPLDFDVIAQEGPLAFVHKPPGLPVHRTGKIFFQTLANLARERLGGPEWAPLNRLDRETGGLVAFARGPEAFRALAPDSPSTLWLKLYAAVVSGRPPAGEGVIDLPLGERPGDPIRSRMHPLGGKRALTLYRTLSTRGGHSLVILSPVTGRKHQLRAHLAALGCPVTGDKMYSLEGAPYLKRLSAELDTGDWEALGARHHLLHAFHLRLEPRPAASGGTAHEAWDWRWDAEFGRYCDRAEAERWSRTSEMEEFLGRIRALRAQGAPQTGGAEPAGAGLREPAGPGAQP